MDLLVQRFGAELKRFKREPAYAQLSAKYGAEPALPPVRSSSTRESEKTVEQQESSAH